MIETIENKKRVFQDDRQVVELYDIGPNPHANEMLVAYLPKEKILFQADMLNPAANGTIPIAPDATVSFGEPVPSSCLRLCVRRRFEHAWLIPARSRAERNVQTIPTVYSHHCKR